MSTQKWTSFRFSRMVGALLPLLVFAFIWLAVHADVFPRLFKLENFFALLIVLTVAVVPVVLKFLQPGAVRLFSAHQADAEHLREVGFESQVFRWDASTSRDVRTATAAVDIYSRYTLARLDRWKNRLVLNSSLHFAIGTAIATAGIGTLLYFFSSLVSVTTLDVTTIGLVREMLPRISIVTLIELLAYFFLDLYKTTLRDVQLVEDEMTDVEQRALAAHVALLQDSALLPSVIASLSSYDYRRESVTPQGGKRDAKIQEQVLSLVHEAIKMTRGSTSSKT